jgi:hypothetical protein
MLAPDHEAVTIAADQQASTFPKRTLLPHQLN